MQTQELKLQQLPNHNSLNNHQRQYLSDFIKRYNQKTPKSKQQAQTYRHVLADVRGSAGFRAAIKEIVYPIVGKYASGSRMWDIDGNEYVDLMMGFGVNLFGYNPAFIKEALTERLEQGIHIGPQSDLAGEVAELFSELTGMERVTFSNTGTEAVMTALRLARAATNRHKIAMFSGSYHGHSDTSLVKAQIQDEITQVVPMFPGVSPSVAADALVLQYGNLESLETIKEHQTELAAVIVEPVQNSRPDIQPKEFLQQLRQLTKDAGIVLIFDEMLTGFRIHPGGAQAWFGVQADIATYGKIVGGGMPIGVIAGKAEYMDRIDGGMWNFGDTSAPQEKTTFFAGTYCKHPLSMVAARAVLKYLKIQGPTLQEQLNHRTCQFIQQLNSYFEEDGVPIKLANFGSIFNDVPFGDPSNIDNLPASENMDLIYYHLIHKGVFLRPGGGLLSTAHTDDDLNSIIQAVKESIQELRNGGFLP
ncbi:aspartate aminotransferase family protein [Fischerella thermalis]|uniref:aspartate aminotransferase family protein n=1 Tax=Fischerella thermalis TaxID=372787 RepID=UPI001A07902A|nr:aspartate aminotransferase family protein [Fischerella thermalis]MBF1989866.1 aspartate aminotransferase family protein [Fischerella thermalis M58_A2018_009]MBF2061168.1 aspartate aminotransferase family protein [Fischerella thermalis M66_A2018_004]MBF2070008.1 aspartate aminotransferase family protein [Fischerella thermalis M48_A2018_028]